MSLLPKDIIKVIAESVGIDDLKDEIAAAMAPDVEYRIREIAQEAIKFMRHSKRQKLTTEDVNSALRLRNVEALYGFSSSDPLTFTRAAGMKDLFFIEDKELSFNDILNAPLPECPLETALTAHWLAIEGVQPAIPQNPTIKPETPSASPSASLSAAAASSSLGASTSKRKRATEAAASSAAASSSGVQVKPVVKHVLSKELQLYYEKITTAVKSNNEKLLAAAVNSLSSDPGIHQLLPYLTQFVSDEVTRNLRNLALLKALMRMVRGLLDSPHLHIEPYLHQLMPPVLTCLVGRRLCENPTEDHWALRDYAANLISLVCQRFGDAYKNLQPRVSKTLLDAFMDLTKPLTTHYGAIVGLTALGHHVVQLLILPNLSSYLRLLEPELQSEASMKRLEARRCYGALLNAAGVYLQHASALDLAAVPWKAQPTKKKQAEEEEEEEEGEKEEKRKEKIKEEQQEVAEGEPEEKRGGHLRQVEEALGKTLPDLKRHYSELYDIFGESLRTFLLSSPSQDELLGSFI
ncbi:histone H4-like TAF Taf6, SAGA complex subunit [Balamuthia mandrillaris]